MGVEDGRHRYAAIVAFNESFYQLRTSTPSMMTHAAFVQRKGRNDISTESNPIAKMVAQYLASSAWVKTYGLSYTDTMKLTYAEWMRMQSTLGDSESET